MILIITNIIWILYSLVEGLREGFYWHFKSNSKREFKFEIHPIFAFQRSLVLLTIALILAHTIGFYSLICVAALMLVFSFFHNGSYYYTRNKLDNNVYQLRWKDQSTTSTAKMTKIMTYRNRTLFMLIGLVTEVFIYIFLIN